MKLIKTLTLALGLTLSLHVFAAADLEEYDYEMLASCSGGGLEVYVVNWIDEGEALYVYQSGEMIEAAWADYRVIEDSEDYKRIGL